MLLTTTIIIINFIKKKIPSEIRFGEDSTGERKFLKQARF